MTAVETTTSALSEQNLALLFQYTVEAYKSFEKLAENLPNPMTQTMFRQFAVDERENRDLIEMKVAATGRGRVRVTLGADMIFNDILEGDLSYRAASEFLIARERTMQKKIRERSEEHTSELQSLAYLVCRLLLEKKKRICRSRSNR